MKHREWDGWAGAGAAAAGALLIAITAIPTTIALPPRDGGVFLYAGRRLLAGESLYRGVWDHKPPGIHLINAAGLFIADGSAWGVWGG